ncbi:MAG: YceI family protein, partial [Desulfobia sp.]
FKSREITKAGDSEYEIDGELTIKDVTRSVTLNLHYSGMQENPLEPGQTIAGFESRLTIDRFDYNVGTGKFYEMGVVGRDVDILITLEMVRED